MDTFTADVCMMQLVLGHCDANDVGCSAHHCTRCHELLHHRLTVGSHLSCGYPSERLHYASIAVLYPGFHISGSVWAKSQGVSLPFVPFTFCHSVLCISPI